MKNTNDFKMAKIYAKAFYECAETEGKSDDIFRDVETLKNIELSKLKEASCFSDPLVPQKIKAEIVEAVAQKLDLNSQTLNMLKILIENGQFKILELVLNDFTAIYNQQHNITEITIETVKELNEKQDALLKEKLRNIFNQEIKINYSLKPEILGGLIIKNNSTLIDLSLKNQIRKIEQLMKGTD